MGSSSNDEKIIVLREGNLYRLRGKPILAMERSRTMTKNMERENMKADKHRGSHPASSSWEEKLVDPSNYVNQVSWYEMTL